MCIYCRCQRLGVNGFLHSWMIIYTQARLHLQEPSVYLKRFTHTTSICFSVHSLIRLYYLLLSCIYNCLGPHLHVYFTWENLLTVGLSYLPSTWLMLIYIFWMQMVNANLLCHELMILCYMALYSFSASRVLYNNCIILAWTRT